MKRIYQLCLCLLLGLLLVSCGSMPPNSQEDKQNEEINLNQDIEYQNDQYGFKIILPENWKGYNVISDKWQGADTDGKENQTFSGPMLLIRHPQWTSAKPRQDIPIMVFTANQWLALKQEDFHIGAAPIGPKLLTRNSEYVFALPARYNYAFPLGYQEVEEILANDPVQILNQPDYQPSLAGLKLGDSKDIVIHILGTEYKVTEHEESGHFLEPFSIWEYPQGLNIVIGSKTHTILEITSLSETAKTNLGIKVGDIAGAVLPLYRSRYEEPMSILGPQLLGVFKLEDGSALLVDFNKEDGIVNPNPIKDTDKVERLILTKPSYIDEDF